MTTTVSNAGTTPNSTFYTGMTLENAKKTNANIELFNQIDALDGIVEGKLSERDIELFEEAEKKHNEKKSNIKTGVALTLDAIGIGAALTCTPIGIGVGVVCGAASIILKCI